MGSLSNKNQSFWKKGKQEVSYSKLAKNEEVDVAVIGGGMSGVLTAYLLAKEGKSVALIEAREMVSGSTGGTTAKLTSQHQLVYGEILDRDGVDVAKDYYDANELGRELVQSLVEKYDIKCDFETMPAYVYTQDVKNKKQMEKEAQAYKEIGINGELVTTIPLDLKIEQALIMNNQAQFHPVKFLESMIVEIEKLGGKIYEHTVYMETERSGDKLILSTDTSFTVTCEQVVFATLFPAEDPDSYFSDSMKPVTSHLMAFKNTEVFNSGMYINDDSPKRTFRGAKDGDDNVFIVGGETHPTGDGKSTEQHYEAIEKFAKEEFGLTEILGYWSEHDMVTADRRPHIGPIKEEDFQMYVMTGYSKWGLAAAAAGAQLMTDLLTGKKNKFKDLFDPQRKISEENDVEESSSGKGRKSGVTPKSEKLKNNEAKRFKVDGKPAGIYKDNEGKNYYLDLACTHLGCEVKWNDGDKTWDCPCHGSVFDAKGGVLAGPAKEPLKEIEPFEE